MIPHHRFCLRQPCFQPRGTLLEDFVHEHACISDRGAMCFEKIRHSSNDSVSLGHCKSEKAFVWAGMWATARKVNTSLSAAYAELARSLRGISPWCCLTTTIMDKIKNLRENAEGNHSWGNHWSNPDDYMLWSLHAVPHVMIPLHLKIPKWNQTATWIFTLTCTYRTCAYAQCLRSTFLAKPLTPPYADQGFACAKCSYDRALIKTSQKGFWGRSCGKPKNRTTWGWLRPAHPFAALPDFPSALEKPASRETMGFFPWFVINSHQLISIASCVPRCSNPVPIPKLWMVIGSSPAVSAGDFPSLRSPGSPNVRCASWSPVFACRSGSNWGWFTRNSPVLHQALDEINGLVGFLWKSH